MFLEEIYENSRRLGQRTALAAGEQEICWGQLWPMAMGLAARLRRQGTGPVALDGGTDLWVPTAMVAFPSRMRFHSSRRSPRDRPL